MKSKRFLVITLLALAVLLILFVGLGAAQDSGGETPSLPDAPSSVEAVAGAIPVQGRLTDASGNPLNGAYNLTFRLYEASSGGTALCEDTDSVDVVNGLFNANVNFCTSSDIDGRQLYLGIQVESDPEMTPRQPIYPVPYAWSLRPGAVISSTTNSAILHIENWGSSGRGLRSYAMAETGTNYGMVGASRSPDGYGGYFYNNGDGTALKAGGTGIIQSTAESYLWISGNNLIKANSWDTTTLARDLYGGFQVRGGSGWATPKVIVLPITIAGQLYGQNVTVTGLDLYYTVSADLTAITNVNMRRQNGVGAGDLVFTDGTDLACTPGGQCEKHWDLTQNNVLSDQQGVLYVAFELGFPSATDYVQIGGVRLTLEHE